MRLFSLAILFLATLLPGMARAEDPPCRRDLAEVEDQMHKQQMSAAKETQVKALLEQATRACSDNNEVVASVTIDQIKAVLKDSGRS
jgi:hypothetical protein